MKTYNLFVDKEHTFYWNRIDNVCTKCSKDINNLIVIIKRWDKINREDLTYCVSCAKALKEDPKAIFSMRITAIITESIPNLALPFVFTPTLSETQFNNFDIALLQKHYGGNTVDKTVYAGKDLELENVTIGRRLLDVKED